MGKRKQKDRLSPPLPAAVTLTEPDLRRVGRGAGNYFDAGVPHQHEYYTNLKKTIRMKK
jgi:hypothetical protein